MPCEELRHLRGVGDVRLLAVDPDHVRAAAFQPLRGRAADAAGGARDERRLACELRHQQLPTYAAALPSGESTFASSITNGVCGCSFGMSRLPSR